MIAKEIIDRIDKHTENLNHGVKTVPSLFTSGVIMGLKIAKTMILDSEKKENDR